MFNIIKMENTKTFCVQFCVVNLQNPVCASQWEDVRVGPTASQGLQSPPCLRGEAAVLGSAGLASWLQLPRLQSGSGHVHSQLRRVAVRVMGAGVCPSHVRADWWSRVWRDRGGLCKGPVARNSVHVCGVQGCRALGGCEC